MTLSQELISRGFVDKTTFKDISELDKKQFIFYFGVDPSADSMTIGNLAMAMMIKLFIKYGHKAFLLTGGATGLIGDPDGKASSRELKSVNKIEHNKKAIANQYKQIFNQSDFTLVDNYDWFHDFNYLEFLREVGIHIPLRQMLNREFIQTRLKNVNSGLNYAEFSYVLIQAYDFYYLNNKYGVNLQLCGADQWGNSIAGIDLIRRINGNNTHVYAGPLIVDPSTGRKFGKSETGAIWLDKNKTPVIDFYQFWLNVNDEHLEHYLNIYSDYDTDKRQEILAKHRQDPKSREGQYALADNITKIVHGEIELKTAQTIGRILNNKISLEEITSKELELLRQSERSIKIESKLSLKEILVKSGLASSLTQATQLIKDGGIYLNNRPIKQEHLNSESFINGVGLLRKGKAYKDTIVLMN